MTFLRTLTVAESAAEQSEFPFALPLIRRLAESGDAVPLDVPVTFFVDPELADDRNLDDVTTITLSYTFFNANRGDTSSETRTTQAGGVHPVPVN